ncbi:MAG: C4-type zinc ribbon domain-containing protein [Dehalococcoidia bacterium]
MQHSLRVADLWQLQEIDSALDARRASLEDAESRLGDAEELDATRAQSAQLSEELRAARATQKDIELQVEDLRAKIAPPEQKLYDGSVRNPKELQALQADVDQLKRQLATLEDLDLEAMSAVEAAEAQDRAKASEVGGLAAAWEEEQAALGERVEHLMAEISVYEAQRLELAEAISAEVLGRYDHIRRAHQGRGVAKLNRNLCTGCRISLPVNIVTKARAGSVLMQCPNCERILFA